MNQVGLAPKESPPSCKRVHDTAPHRLVPARSLRARGWRPDIAGACRGHVVFTMLANDEAVEHVTFAAGGLLERLHVSLSTISVDLSERLAHAHADAGQKFAAAPVFGRPDVAEGLRGRQ